MNPIIDALTQSQVDLYRAHMAYVIDIGLLGITPKEAGAEGFAETYQTFGDPLTENLLHYLQPKVEETYGKKLTPTYSFGDDIIKDKIVYLIKIDHHVKLA